MQTKTPAAPPDGYPSLRRAFGWETPPAGANTARRRVFDAERNLDVDPSDVRGQIAQLGNTTTDGHKPFARRDEDLAHLREQLEILLPNRDGAAAPSAILSFAQTDPLQCQRLLDDSGFPDPETWRKQNEEIIRDSWREAAAAEFAYLQHPVSELSIATVEEYGRGRQQLVADLEARLARLEPPPPSEVPARPFGDVTAGLELEAFFESEVPASLGKRYIRAAFEKLGLHVGPAGWIIKEDSTIKKDPFDHRNNHPEINTPVLEGSEIERQVRLGCHALREMGLKVNVTCALHSNVGHRDGLSLAGAKAILLNSAHNQDLIDPLVPPHRRGAGSYFAPVWNGIARARPGAHPDIIRAGFTEAVTASASIDELCQRTGCIGNETNVNLGKLLLGYVEFRQCAGTLDAEVALDWLRIGADMVNAARETPDQLVRLDYLKPGVELGDGFTAPPPHRKTHLQLAADNARALDMASSCNTPAMSL